MECCGFVGPQEFAYSTLPIDDSCYEPSTEDGALDDEDSPSGMGRGISRSWSPEEDTTIGSPGLRLKQVR